MSVDNLRASRNRSAAVFTEFTRLYKQNESALFCFFEGEDSKYYNVRVKNIARPSKDIYMSCNGKEGVLGMHRMLSARKYYANATTAYFVDRDFDELIRINEIYETPGYSLENFYTSIQCFSEILKSEFKLTELNENYKKCISRYTDLQKEFHDAVELLNVWIACQRDKATRIDISNLSILDFVSIELSGILVKYTVNDLNSRFPTAPVLTNMELDSKKIELFSRTRQKSFRGKFEIEFLDIFLKKLAEEANKGSYPYFDCKVKVVLNLSKRTMISNLSQYADTPDCLYVYLESFKKT
jgi:Protein of unknown function (DUF4435)